MLELVLSICLSVCCMLVTQIFVDLPGALIGLLGRVTSLITHFQSGANDSETNFVHPLVISSAGLSVGRFVRRSVQRQSDVKVVNTRLQLSPASSTIWSPRNTC